jgi:hypothetical protein
MVGLRLLNPRAWNHFSKSGILVEKVYQVDKATLFIGEFRGEPSFLLLQVRGP